LATTNALIAGGLDSSARKNDGNRSRDDLEIKQHGPAPNVFKVVAHTLLKIRIDSTPHLPKASDSRANGEAKAVAVLVSLQFIDSSGTRANETHLPPQHIEKLGEFVKAEAS
jgi:hypothetical protein